MERIQQPCGEGGRAFIAVDVRGARQAARAMDALRAAACEPSPYAGIPFSVKDLFDVRGQITRAGSLALTGPAADRDAIAVARLRKAGLIAIGRTNMTEFAFSGLGLNPHYGTPSIRGTAHNGESPAARRRAQPYLSPTAWPMPLSHLTLAVHAGFRPRSADLLASSRLRRASRAMAWSRCHRRSTRWA
jgi:hypothetical protein